MGIFKKAVIEQGFIKAGFYGLGGSGKTATACLTMIATILEARKRDMQYAAKPVFFIDTEGGSDFMVPLFAKFGIELFVAKTRAFTDLIPAHQEAEKEGSGIITDSVSHPWREFMDSYKRRKKRSFIAFEDWDYLKTEWGKFTTTYTNGSVHAILCGRGGYEYEDSVNDETGKREINKVGTKMKTEGEMAFEPSLLVEMVSEQDIHARTLARTAYVRKDRFMDIDGKEFSFPSVDENYEQKLNRVWLAFKPHILKLNWGVKQGGVDTERTSDESIPASAKPEYKKRAEEKEIFLEKIQNLIQEHVATKTNEGRKQMIDLLRENFGTDSWKQIEFNYSVEQVKDGYDKLHLKLNGIGYYELNKPKPVGDPINVEADVPV